MPRVFGSCRAVQAECRDHARLDQGHVGRPLTESVELGAAVRLGRRDELHVDGEDVYAVAGRGAESALDLVVIRRVSR